VRNGRACYVPPVRLVFYTALAFCAMTSLSNPALADGSNVLIFPKRVVFSERTRSAEVTLVNRGNKPVTYRISLVDRRMTSTGALEDADSTSEAFSARPLLRYSPRQILVRAGERQTVRIAVRKPEDLEPGEYRSHLLAKALPAEGEVASIEAAANPNAMGVRITPLPGISIPVIVRHGELAASVGLSDLAFENTSPDAPPTLSFQLERDGLRSVYGDLMASFTPNHAGKEEVVAVVKGIAIYPPLGKITRRVRLQTSPGSRLRDGRLRLRFRSHADHDGGGEPLTAEAEVALP